MEDWKDWTDVEALIGRIVIKWGHAMGLVYKLPERMGFENFEAIRFGLAQMAGDSPRIEYIRKLVAYEPRLFVHPTISGNEIGVFQQQVRGALKTLGELTKERDAIIHGIPVFSVKQDLKTGKVVRRGKYLVQHREWDEGKQYLPMPDAANVHLRKLDAVYQGLQEKATPMLFEDWEGIFGRYEA